MHELMMSRSKLFFLDLRHLRLKVCCLCIWKLFYQVPSWKIINIPSSQTAALSSLSNMADLSSNQKKKKAKGSFMLLWKLIKCNTYPIRQIIRHYCSLLHLRFLLHTLSWRRCINIWKLFSKSTCKTFAL